MDFSSYPDHIKNSITNDSLKLFQYAKSINLTECKSITHDGLSHIQNVISLNLNKSIKQSNSQFRRVQSATNFSTDSIASSKIIERRAATPTPRFS